MYLMHIDLTLFLEN